MRTEAELEKIFRTHMTGDTRAASGIALKCLDSNWTAGKDGWVENGGLGRVAEHFASYWRTSNRKPFGWRQIQDDLADIDKAAKALRDSLRAHPETLEWIHTASSTKADHHLQWCASGGGDTFPEPDHGFFFGDSGTEDDNECFAGYPTESHLMARLDSISKLMKLLYTQAENEKGAVKDQKYAFPIEQGELALFIECKRVLESRGIPTEEIEKNLKPIAEAIFTWAAGEAPTQNWAARKLQEAMGMRP
ncbi:MAG: hypothetical protein ABSH53_22150 [Holophaga sp.]|jgi:hypothetical protein